MDVLDNLSNLPEWDDEGFKKRNTREDSWKNESLGKAAKELYDQWRTVMAGIYGLYAYAEQSEEMPEGFLEEQKQFILVDAMQIAVKIRASEDVDLYVLLMENAAIVRKNAITIYAHIAYLTTMEFIEKEHGDAVRVDICLFRELFKNWINTFEKDEFEDDWGFFV